MTRRPSRPDLWPALAAVLLAAAWPLGAQVVHPLAFPAAVVLALGGLAVARRPVWGIAVVLALVPLAKLDVDLAGLGLGRPVEPLLIGLSGGLLAFSLLRPSPAGRDGGTSVALLLFVAVSLGSGLQAVEPGDALAPLTRLTGAVMLYLAARRLCRDRHDVLVVAGGLLAGLLVAGTHGIAQALLDVGRPYGFEVEGGDVLARAQGAFFHPNTFGLYLALLIPLAFGMALSRELDARWRVVAAGATAIAIPALVLSYGRGVMIGLCVAGLLWLALVAWRRALAVALVLAVAAAAVAPTSLASRFNGDTADADITDRRALWTAAVDIAQERPLLGAGIGNYPRAYAQRPPGVTAGDRPLLNQGDGETLPFHAHNVVLNVLAEQGYLGVAAFGAVGLLVLAGSLRGLGSRDPLARTLSIAAGAAVTVWSVDGLVNVHLYEQTTVPLLGLVALAECARRIGRAEHGRAGAAPGGAAWSSSAPLRPRRSP